MHVNDLKKAAFYHVMKTGGTSFHMTIARMSSLLGREPTEEDKWKIIMGMHGSYTELFNRFPDVYNKIKNYYKFCFTRNPFSHAVSLYFHVINRHRWPKEMHKDIHKNIIGEEDYKSFNNYLENIYVPQSTVTFQDPNFMNDEWFKFEELDHSFNILLDKFEYNKVELMKTNSTKEFTSKGGREGNIFDLEYPADYKDMYDQQGIDIITKRCKEELDKFNYSF